MIALSGPSASLASARCSSVWGRFVLHYGNSLRNRFRNKKHCGVLLFLSIGERPFEDYVRLYDAGAYGCLMRFETSNKNIYEQIRPGRNLSDRISLIKSLIGHGYVMATGFLIGLPGETIQDIINNILLTRSLKPEMYSLDRLFRIKILRSLPVRAFPLSWH